MRSALITLIVIVATISAGAQPPNPSVTRKAGKLKHSTAPRTPDGHPDLQGVWADNTITPFERPPELAGRASLTDEELDVLRQRAARLFDGTGDIAPGDELFLALLRNPQAHRRAATGDYNQAWVKEDLVFDTRTSQIVDPPDGQLPPFTPAAERRQAAAAEQRRLHAADDPEDRPPQERCLTFGTARVGFLMARNNSYHQIIQTRDYVVINSEMIHESRIIPLDSRPRAMPKIRFWSGESRGRWDGSTLAIETENFVPQPIFRQKPGFPVSGEGVHLSERLTPVDAETLRYEATVHDPTTWTTPWTAVTIWKRSQSRILEYACHEGNHALVNMLKGARALERRNAAAAK